MVFGFDIKKNCIRYRKQQKMTWTIQQFDIAPPKEVWESMVTRWMIAGMLASTLVVTMMYTPVHRILLSKSNVYSNELSVDQQTVVVTHVVEVVILSLLFGPYTYLILSLNFQEQTHDSFRRKVSGLGTFMFSIVIMYLVEIAARHQKPRPLVVIHHLCTFANSILPCMFMSTANIRAASILVYSVTFEIVTFIGLILYRLVPQHKLTRPTILVGMVLFGATRPIQFLWILATLIVTWEDILLWQGIVQILFVCLFTGIQLFGMSIHYGIYKRLSRNAMDSVSSDKHADEDCMVSVSTTMIEGHAHDELFQQDDMIYSV